jgi:hypothetical protein
VLPPWECLERKQKNKEQNSNSALDSTIILALMDLGPFFVDLKGVPLYVEDQDVLRVMQVFEDDGFAPRGLVAASSLKGTMAKNSQDRQPGSFFAHFFTIKRAFFYSSALHFFTALITRIYPLPSHSYECEPNTKVTIASSLTLIAQF